MSVQTIEAEVEAETAVSAPAPAPSTEQVDEGLLSSLMDMGFEENGARRSLLATKGVLDAALNYYLEHSEDAGFLDPPSKAKSSEKASTASAQAAKKKKKPRLIPLELQRLFTQLEHLDIDAQSTTDLTSKGFQWQGMDGRVQHDAHELNRSLDSVA